MKNNTFGYVRDLLFLIGLVSLMGGIWLVFGIGAAMIIGGIILMILCFPAKAEQFKSEAYKNHAPEPKYKIPTPPLDVRLRK